MSVEHLIVDRVFANSLAIPPGTDRWLRSTERKARELRDTLHRVLPEALLIERSAEVRKQLDALLDDEHTSQLHRLLRRPLSQLALGQPAQHTFRIYTETLFRAAEEVLATQQAVEEMRQQRRRLEQLRGSQMPHFTRKALVEARVSDPELAQVRRLSDVRMLHRRLRRVEAELEQLAQHLSPAKEWEENLSLAGIGAVSRHELWAALRLRLRKRASALRGTEPTKRLRSLQVRQVRSLGRAGQWSRTAQKSVRAAAEHLAYESLGSDSRSVAAWEDAKLWTELLRAAEGARFGSKESEDAWQPRISMPTQGSSAAIADGTITYAVPFTSEFVYLSSSIPSPVRVWSRSLREGETVECRVFGDPDSAIPLEWVRSDVAPLFDGAETDRPAWYTTQRRASLQVICAHESGWFARVQSRGALRRLNTPAWQQGDDTATAVRVFASGRDRFENAMTVGPTDAEVRSLLGLQTHEVIVPSLACRVAWLRVPGSSRASAQDALEREHELFRALRARSPYRALASLGRGRTATRDGYLYVPPLAYDPTASELVRQWIREKPMAFVRAMARVLVDMHNTGYALGIYHLSVFSFGLEPAGSRGGKFQPRATLVTGPQAVPLGHSFPLTNAKSGSVPEFANLGFRGVVPAVSAGEIALPKTDAVAFALMFLDVLALRPLLSGRTITRWTELPTHVEAHADAFANRDVARSIAGALPPAGDGSFLLRLVMDIAASEERE